MTFNSQSREARDAHLHDALQNNDYLERRENHRTALLRRAFLLTPTAIMATLLLLYSAQFLPQSLFPMFILGICALAVDIEAIATLRDLRAQPVTTSGEISRLWKKSRYLFIGRVDYMLVDRTLFEINAISATELKLGDNVIVDHWPHTKMVISLARVRGEQPAR